MARGHRLSVHPSIHSLALICPQHSKRGHKGKSPPSVSTTSAQGLSGAQARLRGLLPFTFVVFHLESKKAQNPNLFLKQRIAASLQGKALSHRGFPALLLSSVPPFCTFRALAPRPFPLRSGFVSLKIITTKKDCFYYCSQSTLR